MFSDSPAVEGPVKGSTAPTVSPARWGTRPHLLARRTTASAAVSRGGPRSTCCTAPPWPPCRRTRTPPGRALPETSGCRRGSPWA
eukprot:8650366-Pyramimonas_sp.AAC.1